MKIIREYFSRPIASPRREFKGSMAANCQNQRAARLMREWCLMPRQSVQFALAAHWLNACNSTGSLSAYSDITRTGRTHAGISPSLFHLLRRHWSVSLQRRKTVSYLPCYFQLFLQHFGRYGWFYVWRDPYFDYVWLTEWALWYFYEVSNYADDKFIIL